MLLFLIPLKGRAAAKDWQAVSRLCERTLRSACAQTSPNFQVILSCTDVPEMKFDHPNLTILQREYPAVDTTSKQSQSLDKIYKLAHATGHARRFAPCHVMVLDADDLVSCQLAEFVDRHPDAPGWRVDQGWLYQEGSGWICKHPALSTICGSTFIIRCNEDDLPETTRKGDLLLTAHIPHTELSEELARRGRPLEPLPFPGTIYAAAHGDNWTEGYFFKRRSWRTHLRRLSRMRPVTPKIREDFGLVPL